MEPEFVNKVVVEPIICVPSLIMFDGKVIVFIAEYISEGLVPVFDDVVEISYSKFVLEGSVFDNRVAVSVAGSFIICLMPVDKVAVKLFGFVLYLIEFDFVTGVPATGLVFWWLLAVSVDSAMLELCTLVPIFIVFEDVTATPSTESVSEGLISVGILVTKVFDELLPVIVDKVVTEVLVPDCILFDTMVALVDVVPVFERVVSK